MKTKITLLATLITSSFAAMAADVLYEQQLANDSGFPDDDIPTVDVAYDCSRWGGPAGWVVTGRGGNTCSGYTKSFRFQKPEHNMDICSNGPKPGSRYYIKDKRVAYHTCGADAGVEYFLYTIGDSNWMYSLSEPYITVCSSEPVPSYHLNMNVAEPNNPTRDLVITKRNVDTCIAGMSYRIGKYQATYIPAKEFGIGPVYAPKLKMRVCTNQTLPQYIEITANSSMPDDNCDEFIGDGRGQSVEVVVDYQAICTSEVATTTAKAICKFSS